MGLSSAFSHIQYFLVVLIMAGAFLVGGQGPLGYLTSKGTHHTLFEMRFKTQSSVFTTGSLFDDAKIVATQSEDLCKWMLDEFVNITKAFGQEILVKKTKVVVQKIVGEKKFMLIGR
jgi:hypothetical protein